MNTLKTIMTIAGGVAIGYFLVQYLTGNMKGKVNGRLHKSSSDKKLAGVCGGFAEFLGCDPTIIRVAWALLVCGWGTGVLLYLILALVLPQE